MFGRTGSGKTWKMTVLAQVYHSRFKYKIFDIGAGKRNENTFWCFPSDKKKLWFEFEQSVGIINGSGSKEYKVNLNYPCFSNKIPDKIPQHLPRITGKIFTIFFKSIILEDVAVIIGDSSKNSTYYWNQIMKNVPDNATGVDIENYIDNKIPKVKELSIYKLFLKPALDYHLLAGKDCPTNINLMEEAKDKETIFVLVHDYIPNKNWAMFIMNHICRVILFELAMNDKIPKENIAIFREVGDYMKKVDKDLEAEEQTQIFRNSLTKFVRYGRSGLILFMDTQSPSDTKNLIEGQEDLLCIGEISILDIKDILEKLRTERRLSTRIKDKLFKMTPKDVIIVERRENAVFISPFMPPRTLAYEGKSFIHVWKDKINDWKLSSADLNIIYDLENKAKERLSNKKIEEKIIKGEEVKLVEVKKVIQNLDEEELIIY